MQGTAQSPEYQEVTQKTGRSVPRPRSRIFETTEIHLNLAKEVNPSNTYPIELIIHPFSYLFPLNTIYVIFISRNQLSFWISGCSTWSKSYSVPLGVKIPGILSFNDLNSSLICFLSSAVIVSFARLTSAACLRLYFCVKLFLPRYRNICRMTRVSRVRCR